MSAQLLGAANSARLVATAPAELAEIDRIALASRAALGTAAFDAAYEKGAALTPESISSWPDD